MLIAEVYPSNSRPHYLTREGPETGVYVRLGSTNRQADRELIAELRRSVEGIAFDEMPMPALSADDLDLKAAQDLFGDRRKLDEESMITLRMLRKEQGRLVPTKGAILLFGKDRISHFPDAWVQCGRFIGKDKSDIFDHIDINEPLPKAVDEIMLFLKKHAMRGADFSEIRRKDVWSIPLTILRELVINALVHTDYSQRASPVRIALRLRFIVPLHEPIPLKTRTTAKSRPESGPESGTQVEAQSGAQSEVILFEVNKAPQSANDLTAALGLSSKTGAFKRAIKILMDQGLIEYTLPDPPQSRLQKYRITSKGRALL